MIPGNGSADGKDVRSIPAPRRADGRLRNVQRATDDEGAPGIRENYNANDYCAFDPVRCRLKSGNLCGSNQYFLFGWPGPGLKFCRAWTAKGQIITLDRMSFAGSKRTLTDTKGNGSVDLNQ